MFDWQAAHRSFFHMHKVRLAVLLLTPGWDGSLSEATCTPNKLHFASAYLYTGVDSAEGVSVLCRNRYNTYIASALLVIWRH